ncbi:methyltransferase [Halobacterium zhouii]|uniref:methyltransferase n=1 Tax=Halobacterium zhouii TaxID=2902624 RepID=UPI001E4AB630|nr:methyltransferase [Halobacterium zhouii]
MAAHARIDQDPGTRVVGVRRAPYELALDARVDRGPSTFAFRTADGVCSKQAFRDAELLLVDALWTADPSDLLVAQGNYGVVATVLASVADAVQTTESSARAAALCERNAAANGADVPVTLATDPGALDATFDAAAYAPKPYTPLQVGNQRIAHALDRLRPGSRLYVAAMRNAGASRYASTLEHLAGSVDTLDERNGCQLLAATRPEQFAPAELAGDRELTPTVDGVSLSLVTAPGVFAASALDHGTRLLLETARVEDGERVLDLCCGYGAAGAYAARAADCEVWLTDDDRVATECAERSLAASGVDGTVVTADCLAGVRDQTFDTILSNPPTHAGDDVLQELLDGASDVLAPGGDCWLVHHRDLDLRPKLGAFEAVERVADGDEHVVLHAT